MALGPRHDRIMSATLSLLALSRADSTVHVRLRGGYIGKLCSATNLSLTRIGV